MRGYTIAVYARIYDSCIVEADGIETLYGYHKFRRSRNVSLNIKHKVNLGNLIDLRCLVE